MLYWPSRVPKELISRFVKLCPTCRERRGAVCLTDDGKSPPHVSNATEDLPDEIDAPQLKRLRREAIRNNSESSDILDMPAQLVNGSSTFQNQNRWLSGFLPPRSAYDEPYTQAASFSSHNSFRELDPNTTSAHVQFSTANDASQDVRPASSHLLHIKQEAHYKYE